MKDRIKQYIEFKGITAGELAVMLDVQRSNISHILNGRNKPGAALIEKLLLVFPDLNARWLLTGKGNMNEGIEDSVKSIQAPLPLYAEKDTIEEPKSAKVVQKNLETSLPVVGLTDDVEKMILLYKDGSFEAFNNRNKK
jgi:transcriptional regulator with XRE-family HTH domain